MLQGYGETPVPKDNDAGSRGGTYPEPPANKISTIEINDFSRAVMSQVVERPRGGVALQMNEGAWEDEFQAVWRPNNTYHPALSVDSENHYAIAWAEDRNGTGCDINIRRLDERTRKASDDIKVATCPGRAYYQTLGMATDSSDCILLAYVTERNGTGRGIYFQRLGPAGDRIGAETKIPGTDDATISMYSAFPIAVNCEDRFIIAWNNNNTTSDIVAAILDGDGNALVTDITICAGAGYQDHMSVAAASDGRFVVAWIDGRSLFYAVHARMLESDGTLIGDDFAVSDPDSNSFRPVVAARPKNNILIAWSDASGHPSSGIVAQRFDTNGSRLGDRIPLSNTTGDIMIAVNSSSFFLLVRADYWDSGSDFYAQWFDPGGHKLGNETRLTTNGSRGEDLRIVVDSKDDVLVAWEQGIWGTIYARQIQQPYLSSGYLEVDIISPAFLWSWLNLTKIISLPGLSNNSLQFLFSIDDGLTWLPVPDNGSLADAGPTEKLRLRVYFSTTDEMTSPVLYNMTLRYISNRPPEVSLPPDISTWKNETLEISANASDPDGDDLGYAWAQTSGPKLDLNQAQEETLSVTPMQSGLYGLQVIVNDGYNTSLPAHINLTVMNRPPIAVLKANATSAQACTPILFDASESSDADDLITSYSYNFGDGNSSGWVTNRSIGHVFAIPGKYRANLSVMDIEGAVANSVDLNISVCAPDLVINRSDITISPARPEEGNKVLITVNIHNHGDWQVGEFPVVFSIDGKALAEDITVTGLAGGANITVNKTWTARSGDHVLIVSLDPNHTLTEFNLSNNRASAGFSVSKAPSTEFSQEYICGATILIAVVSMLIILLWKRRRPAVAAA